MKSRISKIARKTKETDVNIELNIDVTLILLKDAFSQIPEDQPSFFVGIELSESLYGKTIDLTAKEYDLLELLMKNPRRVYSRESLMDLVWGYSYAGDYRTVDVHVRRLREKLERVPAEPAYIMTKWGVGYYFQGENQPTV